MKFTCLSKGRGFHFPPCYILDICGFRVLLDCPLDLSALTIFSPIPTNYCTTVDEETRDWLALDSESVPRKRSKIEKPFDARNLIHAEPLYKIVSNLHLWDVSFIDVVLISSPMGMLGLPFLTRMKGFSAKIYLTEATARLGQLMMEDLVSMHMEFRQFYGREESGFPQWLKWEELEMLPSILREIAIGKDGMELGGWMPLYSAVDVKECMQKVQSLKYAEETCYNGTLVFKAFSSGLEIGTCNWTINGPKRNIACLSSSIFASAPAKDFDYHALQGNDLILYSDFSCSNMMEDVEDGQTDINNSAFSNEKDKVEESAESLLITDESSKEMDKLAYICQHAIESIQADGSVLITIDRLGIVLHLLEQIALFQEASAVKVPIFMISSVAEELLAYTNIMPEWLCKHRQEKLYSGTPLFEHVELVNNKQLHLCPAVHSHNLITNWQEPCIVFAPHWSLRLGPVVHLLHRWHGDGNSLLVMEEGVVDAKLALLPFKPMSMKILHCSFLSGIKSEKIHPLLTILQPKLVLFPEDLKPKSNSLNNESFSFIHYSENETLRIPSSNDGFSELQICKDVAWKLNKKKLKGSIKVVRLTGEILIDHGKNRLLFGNESPIVRPLMHWGLIDLKKLMKALGNMGIKGSVEKGEENDFSVNIYEPNKGLVEVRGTSTVISGSDENLVSLIFKAVSSVLNGV